jgi:RecA-family ATPase
VNAFDAAGVPIKSVAQWLDFVAAMPEAEQHHTGVADISGAADVLLQHWTAGQRHLVKLYAIGAMLHADIDDGVAQQIIDCIPGAAQERPPSVEHMRRQLDGGRHVHGFPSLMTQIGEQDAREFLRRAGAEPPKNPLPVTFAPLDPSWRTERPQPLEFTVKPQVPRRCATLCTSEAGLGKTTYGMRMAVCVAGGRSFFGLETAQGRVVYLNLEDNADSLRRRFHWVYSRELAQMRKEGRSQAELDAFDAALDKNLVLTSAVGWQLHLISCAFGQIEQTGVVAALIERIGAPLELLIVDPLARAHGGNENDNTVATALVNACERIANALGCAVLILHHVGKSASKERDESMNAARGASGFISGVRSSVRLIAVDAKDAGDFPDVPVEKIAAGDFVRVVHNKANDMKKDAVFYLLREGQDFVRFTPEAGNAKTRRNTQLTKLHEWFCREERRPFAKAAFENGFIRREAFAPLTVSRDEARALIDRAMEEGAVVVAGTTAKGGGTLLTFAEAYEPDPL